MLRLDDVATSSSTLAVAAADVHRSLKHHLIYEQLVENDAVREVPLNDLVVQKGIVDGPFGSNLKSEHWTDSGVPVVQGQHITSGSYVVEKPYFVSNETFRRLRKSNVKGGDLVMIKKGMSCGAVALIPDDSGELLLSSNTMRIRANGELVNSSFLYHFLSWYRESGLFDGLIGSTQQKATTLRDVREIRVPLPTPDVQVEIGRVLNESMEAVFAAKSRIEDSMRRQLAALARLEELGS
jgi:type I restriction enzyme S subunit